MIAHFEFDKYGIGIEDIKAEAEQLIKHGNDAKVENPHKLTPIRHSKLTPCRQSKLTHFGRLKLTP